MSQIHILEGQSYEILDYITAKNIISDSHKKSLEDTLETYNFITFADKEFSQYLEKRNRIIIPDEDGTLKEFVIAEAVKYKDSEGYKAQVFANASYLELKKAAVLYPDFGFSYTAAQHAGRALNNTGWTLGNVESARTITLTISSHTNPYEFLKRIANEFDLELNFRIEHDGNRIIGRYVDLLERVGMWRGREVEFGKDLMGIKRTETQDIVTALLGIGPEADDGTRIEVLVEDEEALQRWGWYDEYGNIHHLIEPYEIQSERTEMTEKEALQYTRTALNKRINTQISYETTISDLEHVPGMENKKIRFGDTIKIKDTKFNPPLYLEARIYEQSRSIKSQEKKDIKLGDYVEYTEEQVNAIWEQLRKEIRNKISAAEVREQIIDYTYDKLTIDNKDETVFEEGKTFAEAVGIDAKEYAEEQDGILKVDVEDYANKVAAAEAAGAVDEAKGYAVAKEVYENQMRIIAEDIADRAPIDYIDGQLVVIDERLGEFNIELEKKIDGSNVYTINQVDNMINNTVSVTKYTEDMNGIITDIESQGTRIGQNERAIGLKADDSKVNEMNDSLTRSIGNLEVRADGIVQNVNEIITDFTGFIDRKNLLPYMEMSGLAWTTGLEYAGGTDRIRSPFIKVEPLTTYVFSIDGESAAVSWFEYDENKTIIRVQQNARISYTTGETTSYIRLVFQGSTSLDEKYQLEKGAEPTSYVPYIADGQELDARISRTEGEISTLAGEVSLRATQTDLDNLSGRVSNAEAELLVLPGQISSKVDASFVNNAIDDLEIGGTNLAQGTKDDDWVVYGTVTNTTVTSRLGDRTKIIRMDSKTSSTKGIQQSSPNRNMKLKSGEEYTLSFLVRGTVPALDYIYIMNNGTSNQSIYMDNDVEIKSSIEFHKMVIHFTANKYADESTGSYIMISGNNIPAGQWFEIQEVKLEKGNKASDWQQSPKDIEIEFGKQSSEINQLSNQISSKVSEGEARSIFTQEARSFTFDADQINFNGHVFGDNATFNGKIEGAEIDGSTFTSVSPYGTSTGKLVISGATIEGTAYEGETNYNLSPFGLYTDYISVDGKKEFIGIGAEMNGIQVGGDEKGKYVFIRTDGISIGGNDVESIVSQGENNNGHWIRYESGLQICWNKSIAPETDMTAKYNIYRSETQYWSYPAGFASNNVVVVGGVNSYVRWFNTGGVPGVSSASIMQFGYNAGSSYSMNVIAIGWWKQ